ncbi:hypothetical protein AWW66_03210 [Micromonospora rosaria]|uniref:Uncharacterized protein n=1 Tax=Micromonospora rosaria TaxID=47874 RepID=A0A136PY29_9ACTN|nr:hypothetical protein [Micromonospora rosaria]KXK63335.1 hypothetical protein AWW66_03210 [Micromonospora rosaria]
MIEAIATAVRKIATLDADLAQRIAAGRPTHLAEARLDAEQGTLHYLLDLAADVLTPHEIAAALAG